MEATEAITLTDVRLWVRSQLRDAHDAKDGMTAFQLKKAAEALNIIAAREVDPKFGELPAGVPFPLFQDNAE